MVYSRTFFRDRIVLNNDFKSRIKLETAPLGTTLLLAAREFSVEGTFVLEGRDLVLLADSFDSSHGVIQVKAPDNGSPGPKVTVVCRQLAGVNITAAGGMGPEGEVGNQVRKANLADRRRCPTNRADAVDAVVRVAAVAVAALVALVDRLRLSIWKIKCRVDLMQLPCKCPVDPVDQEVPVALVDRAAKVAPVIQMVRRAPKVRKAIQG